MTEQKVKNRGWVKNAAIIFLAVLLVLTLFSETIMNRSLPEVSTARTESGTITAKIRGTGSVVANENYEVTLQETREVLAVLVKTGDVVEVGDLLFSLKQGDSTELETAKDELDQMEYDYQLSLLEASGADYTKENRDITLAREALEEAKTELARLSYSEETIIQLKAKIEQLKIEIQNLEIREKAAADALADLGEKEEEGDDSQLQKDLDAAEEALSAAKTTLNAERIRYQEHFDVLESIAQWRKTRPGNPNYSLESYMQAVAEEYAGTKSAASIGGDDDIEGLGKKITALALSDVDENFDEGTVTLDNDPKKIYKMADLSEAYYAITKAEDAVTAAEDAIDVIEDKIDALPSGNSAQYNRLKDAHDNAKRALDDANFVLENHETQLKDEEAKKTEFKTVETDVKTKQVALEDLVFNLSESQKADGKEQAKEALALNRARENLEKKREEVAKLQGGASGSNVTANVAGTVKSINITAGNTAAPATPLMIIEVADRGYSVTIPVTIEQSKRVRVGDSAEVTSGMYWGVRYTATLAGMKPDPENPTTNKLLVFDVGGDEIESGASLSLTLAQQSATYDIVVPNSSLRQDNNGTYVLVVDTKSTPFGSRQIAKRVDVTVLATDDTSSAVSGGLSQWGDYVITNTSAPIEAGQQIRTAT